jgi:2-polyprenyl-3-methyl-5-hydroxy-6-metoxy-1,4-benzoquinol methylase
LEQVSEKRSTLDAICAVFEPLNAEGLELILKPFEETGGKGVEKITDWNALWRELVGIKEKSHRKKLGGNPDGDVWADRAYGFKEGVKRRWKRPDSSRAFILSQMGADSTVLDIGAGTGAWSMLLAPHVKHVTAVEPSSSMIKVMQESLSAENITNVSIVRGSWPDASVEPHDYSLCSHAMYACEDLAAFIRKMVACTRRMCFLLMRAPSLNGVRAEAALHLWGQPLDSPNFTIAYNILLQMGIYANVQMENTGMWKSRTSQNLQEALTDMKRFLALDESGEHDAYLMDLLQRRLTCQDGHYVWPPEVRSVLIYWQSNA